MRSSLIASTVLHGTLLVAGLIALPDVERMSAEPVESLPVELLSIEELTIIQQGSKRAKQLAEASVAPTTKPKPVEDPKGETEVKSEAPVAEKPAPRQTQSAAEPAPQSEPEPSVDPQAPKQAEAEPQEVAEPAPEAEKPKLADKLVKVMPISKPRVRPRPEPEKKTKRDFDPNKIAALLNKTTPAGGGVAQDDKPAALGTANGRTNVKLSVSELDALRSQVARCWNPPTGAQGAETLKVRLQFNLSREGEVTGAPQVLNSVSHRAFPAAAQSAVRAVYRCGPYQLPVAKYDAWQTVIINFDPQQMLGY
ncbi:energy transducer TonB family protein [Polycladidibacter hongkongensis]|uniref:energy transducer TonB family protein n=1 Tax=Polycladidibacter hongkongensis TaxID=1647556 RepID=UPI00082C0B89|nr:hypothetical protein [Pseudovibrio hongkongensis]